MDRDILEQLYVRYYKPAFLYTLSLCKNREAAEDIVADAFEKAYLSLSDDHPSFQYWLLRVCKNLWIDLHRREKRIAENGGETLQNLTDHKSPEQSLLQGERLALLYRCIQQMPSADQELLTLHYFSNLPLKEIAMMLRVTPGSVKTRIFRARQTLKKLMKENHYDI